MLAAQVTTGASASMTATTKLQLAVLPEVSVAVQVTAFVPLAKVLPLVGLQLTVTPGQLSVAVAAKFTNWLQEPAAVFVTMSEGHAIVGGSRSRTAIVNVQWAVLPEASVAVQ